jgi:hypothetical protein
MAAGTAHPGLCLPRRRVGSRAVVPVTEPRDSEQLDIETAIEEAEQGFDAWDIFAPPDDDEEEPA